MTRLQSRAALAAVLVAASLALLIFGGAPQLDPARSLLQWPLTAVQSWLTRAQAGSAAPAPELASLQQRAAELEAENDQLRSEVARLKESEAELRTLSGLLNYAGKNTDNQYLAANVIGRDPSPFLSYLILDRGSDAGIRRDMPVVTGDGLVGRVVEVTSTACRVRPITDPGSAINVRLQDSREEGVVVGRPGGGLELQFISQQAEVKDGELALTSGLGGEYPPGIILGSVSSKERLEYEVLQRAVIAPAVNFNRLEIVLIIVNFTPLDFTPFFPATPGAP